MDFLLFSSTLIKFEVAFLLINLVYILFHIFFSITNSFVRIINIIKPNKKIQVLEGQEQDNSTIGLPKTYAKEKKLAEKTSKRSITKDNDKKLTRTQKDVVSEIIKIIKTKIARGEYTEAKAKIIEGLSVDKFNKDLNCLLAFLYEKDKDYKKAELIYKDLIIVNDLDTEVYLKLGFVLSVQGKYEVAYEIYKKLHSIEVDNVEAIEMLANIGHHLGFFEESKKYTKLFLRNSPRNIDMLYLQALNYVNLEERKEGLEMLKKVKIIEPYNVKVNELIEKVQLELELEDNFTGKKK